MPPDPIDVLFGVARQSTTRVSPEKGTGPIEAVFQLPGAIQQETRFEGVRGGPGALGTLMPVPAGVVGATARGGQALRAVRAGRGPNTLREAGRFGMVDDINRLARAQKADIRSEASRQLAGTGLVTLIEALRGRAP